MKKTKFVLCLVLILMMATMIFTVTGCETREATMVSHNLSLEADNFNVGRQLTIFNTRNSDVLFQMTGNFSIKKATDGDLEVIGENDDGTYYKHFVCLSRDISYTVVDLGETTVSRYKFTINFNPNMILPVEVKKVD